MSGFQRLNDLGRRAVVKALAPAEPIIFVTAPDPREAARAAMPTAGAGALLATLGAPIAWISVDAAVGAIRFGGGATVPILLACLAVPACMMGVFLMLGPYAAHRRASDTVLLITDRRLVTISLSGRPSTALPASAILGRRAQEGRARIRNARDPPRGAGRYRRDDPRRHRRRAGGGDRRSGDSRTSGPSR